MKKKSTLKLVISLLLAVISITSVNLSVYADEAVVDETVTDAVPVQMPDIYFSFTDYPQIALKDRKLSATVTVTWIDEPITATAQWYYNGEALPGWRNENFIVTPGAKSTLNYDIPRYEYMPNEGWIGFELTVGGKSAYINQKIDVENFTYAEYHPEESQRVLASIKHIYVDATLNYGTTAYTNYRLKNSCGWVNAGTKVKYIDYYDIKEGKKNIHVAAKILLPNGYTCWVPHGALSISRKNYTVYYDHSNSDKEIFVNAKNYSSDTDWLVWINLERQKINVFKGSQGKWKIEAVFPCATGKNTTPTIDGVFKYSKYLSYWDFEEYYVKYVMVFNGGHAFHTRTYRTSNDKLLDETIGTTTSLGCVRMYDQDVLWLRDNLPLYSTVVVY